MKSAIKAVFAVSTLALALGAYAQLQPKSPEPPSSSPQPMSPSPSQGPMSPSPSGTATGPATPGAKPSGGPVTFQSLDANKDGSVSRAEAEAAPDVMKAFSTLDKNKDGKLDQGEFASHKGK